MNKKRLPSLGAFARREDPLSDMEQLVQRLKTATAESRYLEWKLDVPVSPSATVKAKYRFVKACISFANTEGGFVLLGVDQKGRWKGLTEVDLDHSDPAKLTELINGCIFPDIPNLNYGVFKFSKKNFAVVHVPPSQLVPHVTTKPIEVGMGQSRRPILRKHAVYTRHGAKSDLATPSQYQKIIQIRTDQLRLKLLARIKEVPVPIPVVGKSKGGVGGTTLTVARSTDDPSAPVVRLTRSKDDASGVFLHEELSDGIFDEINNLLEANELISKGREHFMLGEEVYYRICAKRQHVDADAVRLNLLTSTAMDRIYAPHLYWLTRCSPGYIAKILMDCLKDDRQRHMYQTVRLVTLLGPQLSDWLQDILEKKWKRFAQKPDYYWAFQKIRSRGVSDSRLAALRTTSKASLNLPNGETVIVGDLLEAPDHASTLLSQACIVIFEGEKEFKSLARALDIISYGEQVASMNNDVVKNM